MAIPHALDNYIPTSALYKSTRGVKTESSDLISLNDVKDLLQIEREDTDYDNRLNTIIQSAIVSLEAEIGRKITKDSYIAEFYNIPAGTGCLEIDTSDVDKIVSVYQYDKDEKTILRDTDYQFVLDSRAYIRLLDNTKYFNDGEGLKVTVEFTRGIDNNSEEAPLISSALRYIVKDLYMNETAGIDLNYKTSPSFRRVVALLQNNNNISKYSS